MAASGTTQAYVRRRRRLPPARSAPSHGVRVGQSVRHARFGEGVVINLEGSGDDARAQVNFGPQGIKWLALAVAKLVAA